MTAPNAPTFRRVTRRVFWPALMILVGLVSLSACLSDNSGSARSSKVDGSQASAPAERVKVRSDFPESTTTPETTAPPETTQPTSPPPTGLAVVQIIDGDTIEVEGGQRVRLIGIDTPERGQCGYSEAAFVLAGIIRGRPVVLVPGARDDTDRYGRLLRYVEVDGVDANLEMIRSGRAIARYDSRDGYGRHPRQDQYIEVDAATPSANNCAPAPAATTPVTAAPAPAPQTTVAAAAPVVPLTGATDPRFGTCKEAKSHGYGPYTRGVHPEYDWYIDRDRDGIVCE